jgi:hypothetical protein
MEEAIVEIDWAGPLELSKVADLQDDKKDVGIYAIYGPHLVYGQYTLVYIGLTNIRLCNRVSNIGISILNNVFVPLTSCLTFGVHSI